MTNKFKVGDKAKITGNTNDHDFEIGEIVVLESSDIIRATWRCFHLDRRDFWHVKESDMEPYVEPTEQPTGKPLTLQEKFEQGWSMKYIHTENCLVVDMLTFKSGDVAVVYSDGDVTGWSKDDFEETHTITPPAPKVERGFTPIDCNNRVILAGRDYHTLDEAKANAKKHTTCILEHEKQGDKWVFVKAHTV